MTDKIDYYILSIIDPRVRMRNNGVMEAKTPRKLQKLAEQYNLVNFPIYLVRTGDHRYRTNPIGLSCDEEGGFKRSCKRHGVSVIKFEGRNIGDVIAHVQRERVERTTFPVYHEGLN